MIMHRFTRRTASALALAVCPTIVAAAPFDIYTDRTAWETAIAGYTLFEDSFDDDIASAQSITFASGVTSTGSSAPASAAVNNVSGGTYNTNNDPDGSGGFQATTWQFPTAISAFGMDFIDSASNFGITVTGDFDGTGDLSFDTETVLGGFGDGFIGIVGDGLFDLIVFTPTPNQLSRNEGYSIDNLAFASAPAVIPVPASIWLVLAGLGALVATRRFRD